MSGRSRRSSPLHFSDTDDDAPIGGGRQHDDDLNDLDFAPPPRLRRHRADTDDLNPPLLFRKICTVPSVPDGSWSLPIAPFV